MVAPMSGMPLPFLFAIYALLIAFFAAFLGNMITAPRKTGWKISERGGFIPGVRPGKPTADFLAFVHRRLFAVGLICLGIICVVPDFLVSAAGLSGRFFGATLLIVVVTILDTAGQARARSVAAMERDENTPPLSD